ncbi:hypothetical protein HDV64DRAFT_25903 [Trichoderma sp. TUCIM 5745]
MLALPSMNQLFETKQSKAKHQYHSTSGKFPQGSSSQSASKRQSGIGIPHRPERDGCLGIRFFHAASSEGTYMNGTYCTRSRWRGSGQLHEMLPVARGRAPRKRGQNGRGGKGRMAQCYERQHGMGELASRWCRPSTPRPSSTARTAFSLLTYIWGEAKGRLGLVYLKKSETPRDHLRLISLHFCFSVDAIQGRISGLENRGEGWKG